MSASLKPKVTPLQYALDLFIENAPARTPIDSVESSQDIGYQKNRVFARIVGLGLSARRFVDAAYFIVAQEPELADTYEVSLNLFKWLMRYESHNKKHFSSVIRSVKSSMLEVVSGPVVSVDAKGRLVDAEIEQDGDEEDRLDDETEESTGIAITDEEGDWLELIGRVSVRNGIIRFRVPVELQRLIKDPETSYWTSLLVTSRFTLIYARAIYDHLRPETETGRTEWKPLELIRSLPGKSWANFAEFKYFKRDYLDPAIKQINELSDIEVSYETRAGTPGSRKRDQIRFTLARKETAGAADADMLASAPLYLQLYKEFGLSDKQFEEIRTNRAKWTDARIEQAMEYVRHRIERGDDVRRPSAYLMRALADSYRVSDAEKQVAFVQAKLAAVAESDKERLQSKQSAVKDSVAAADVAADHKRNEEQRQAREYFEAADNKTREEYVRKFISSSTIGVRAIERQGLKVADVTEANIMQLSSIAATFASFVAASLRKSGRAGRT
jgi:hypothetical protein